MAYKQIVLKLNHLHYLFSWQSIILIGITMAVIVSFVAIFGLNRKLKAIIAILTILQKPSLTQAIEMIDKQAILDFFKDRPAVTTPAYYTIRSPIIDNSINPLDVIFLVLFIHLGIYVAWRSYRVFHPKYETSIIIEVGNQDSNIRVKLLTIPHSPLDYSFTASTFIKSLSVTGFMRTQMHISWPDFMITHKFAPLTYTLPNKLGISYLTARKITRLLKTNYYCLVFTTDYEGRTKLIDLPKTNWHLGSASAQINTNWPMNRKVLPLEESQSEQHD